MQCWHDDTPEPARGNGRLPWPEALFAMLLLALGAWGLVYVVLRALGVVA